MSSSTPSARSASSHAWLIEGFSPSHGYVHVEVHLPFSAFSTRDNFDLLMRAAQEALESLGDGVKRMVFYWRRLTGDDSAQRSTSSPPFKALPRVYAWLVCGYHPQHGQRYIRVFLPVGEFLTMGAFIEAEKFAIATLQEIDSQGSWTVALAACQRLSGDDHLSPDHAGTSA